MCKFSTLQTILGLIDNIDKKVDGMWITKHDARFRVGELLDSFVTATQKQIRRNHHEQRQRTEKKAQTSPEEDQDDL